VAIVALYFALLLVEVDWNLGNWRPRLDSAALALAATITTVMGLIWVLAGATRDHISQAFSLVICLILVALGIYVLPPEPLTTGLFGRDAASPFWYRGSRAVIMAIPVLIWTSRTWFKP
jgi:hypothetical protein